MNILFFDTVVLFSLLTLEYDTLGEHKKSCIIEVSPFDLYGKWCKFIILLRENKNISNMSLKI